MNLRPIALSMTMVAAMAMGSAVGTAASAATITHTAEDFTGAITTPFSPVAEIVGTFYSNQGVDYSWGNVEGVFNDPTKAICGINGAGDCDLKSAVDGQIVDTISGLASLTSFVSVEAGSAPGGVMMLSVFDVGMNLIDAVFSSPPMGPSGYQTMTIDFGSVFDIAYFSVSTLSDDNFGVITVTIKTPSLAVVPLPAGLPLMVGGLILLGAIGRRKKS